MKVNPKVGLEDVRRVYSGPEGDLWELVMGEQIHIGGLASSLDLAEKAGIREGWKGVDLCCCNGAGMRFLVRFRKAAFMTGVDATEKVIERGREYTRAEGLEEKVRFVHAEATDTGLPGGEADFAWGEDAWCYVSDKEKLVAEAARIVKPGGVIAFTDWVEGPAGLTAGEADRFLTFMKFPGVQDIKGYEGLLEKAGCKVLRAEDTGRFAPYVDLYKGMLGKQLTYDALKIIGFDRDLFEAMAGEMAFMGELARAGKIAQGLFVAVKE